MTTNGTSDEPTGSTDGPIAQVRKALAFYAKDDSWKLYHMYGPNWDGVRAQVDFIGPWDARDGLKALDALEAQVAACRDGSDWAMAEQFEGDLKRMTEERDRFREEALESAERLVSYGLAIGKLGDLLDSWRMSYWLSQRDKHKADEQRDALAVQAQEAQAAVAVLVERLGRVGRFMPDEKTCAICRRADCKDAYVSTCEGWSARHTLANLPAAIAEAVAHRQREQAFIAAYDRYAACVAEFPNDPSACGEWLDAVETKRQALGSGSGGMQEDE